MNSELLTVAEAAKLLRLHSNSIYKLIETGVIPAIRIGSKVVRIRACDIDALLQPTNVPTPNEAA
jgi:excisionase family DNA binding protein